MITETGSVVGKWNVYRPTVVGKNGAWTTSGLLVQADSATANADVLTILGKDVRQAPTGTTPALMPAGDDDHNSFDTPVKLMLDDAKTEVARLISINNDPACRNTVVVLIVGGGEGNTNGGATNTDLATVAATYRSISSRRVPIYVIALAPPTSDVAGLKAVAAQSGGQYFEITKAQIDAAVASPLQIATAGVTAPAGTIVVPEVVNAINTAVQHVFASSTDFSATPSAASLPRADATLPVGPVTEYQVTSPIVGTVNLNNAKDITGAALYTGTTQPSMIVDKASTLIPQRNNMMVTTGVAVPGMDAQLQIVPDVQAGGRFLAADGLEILFGRGGPADLGRACAGRDPPEPLHLRRQRQPRGLHHRERRDARTADGPDQRGGRQRDHRRRAEPLDRRRHRLDAGDHEPAVARSSARRCLPGLCRRQQEPADDCVGRFEPRHHGSHRCAHRPRSCGGSSR